MTKQKKFGKLTKDEIIAIQNDPVLKDKEIVQVHSSFPFHMVKVVDGNKKSGVRTFIIKFASMNAGDKTVTYVKTLAHRIRDDRVVGTSMGVKLTGKNVKFYRYLNNTAIVNFFYEKLQELNDLQRWYGLLPKSVSQERTILNKIQG